MNEKKVKSKRKPEPKLSSVEKLLNKVRREPSPTCNDRRQLTLEGAIKQRAFADLDEAIKQTLSGD